MQNILYSSGQKWCSEGIGLGILGSSIKPSKYKDNILYLSDKIIWQKKKKRAKLQLQVWFYYAKNAYKKAYIDYIIISNNQNFFI